MQDEEKKQRMCVKSMNMSVWKKEDPASTLGSVVLHTGQ